MARARSTRVVVSITNVEPTMLLMRKYGKSFSNDVRDAVVTDVTPFVAHSISAAAMGSTSQAQAVAGTFKPVRDRLPAVRGFGATVVTKNGAKAGDIGFGANWGGGNRVKTYAARRASGRTYTVTRRTTRQFGPWTGGGVQDRFIYSTIHLHQAKIDELWQSALDDVYQAWVR